MVPKDYFQPAMLFVLGVVTMALVAWVGALPGIRARRCSHPRARAISVMGWASLAIWPLWPVAMIWAIRRPMDQCGRRPQVRVRVTPSSRLGVSSHHETPERRDAKATPPTSPRPGTSSVASKAPAPAVRAPQRRQPA